MAPSSVKWDRDMDIRIFLTMMTTQNIKPDYEKVSAALGITKGALVARMFILRQQARKLNGGEPVPGQIQRTGGGGHGSPHGSGNGEAPKKRGRKPKVKKEEGMEGKHSDLNGFGNIENPIVKDDPPLTPSSGLRNGSTLPTAPMTPTSNRKVLSGRIEKKRSAPRSIEKANYRLLNDPAHILGLEDIEDGEDNQGQINPGDEMVTSEDSAGSDKEWDAAGEDIFA